MVGKTPQVREIVFNVLDDNGERTVVAKGATTVDVGDTQQLFTRTSNLEVLSSNNFSNISNVQSNIVSIEAFLSQFAGSTYSPLLLTLQNDHVNNVNRIDTLITDLTANAIIVDGTYSNVTTLQTDTGSNAIRLANLESYHLSNVANINGNFSNISILNDNLSDNVTRIQALETDISAVTNFGDITGLQSNVEDLMDRVTTSTIRIGNSAGGVGSSTSALAIGNQAGNEMGSGSIAIGALAGFNDTSQQGSDTQGSIVISSVQSIVRAPRRNTLVIKTSNNGLLEDDSNLICMMGSNTETGEITHTSLLKLIDSNVHISTNVSIANDTILLTPDGNGSFGSNIHINQTLDVGGASSFGGAMTLDDNLETTGTSSFGGKMEVNNDIDCNGQSFIMKNVSLNKIIFRDNGTGSFSSDVDINGTLNVGSTSSFGGAMTLDNTLETTGTSSFGDVMTLNSNLAVTNGSFSMNDGIGDKILLQTNGVSSFHGMITTHGGIDVTSGTVGITHPGAELNIGTGTNNINATIDKDGTSTFNGAMTVNNTLTVGVSGGNHRTILNGGLTIPTGQTGSFLGATEFESTSSFGDVMTVNNDINQMGGSFSMFGDDGTTKNVEILRNGTGSFKGTLSASAIECTGDDGNVEIFHATNANLKIGTSNNNFNATIDQAGNSSFAGTMGIGGDETQGGDILSINGSTTWTYDGANQGASGERCKLTVGANNNDSSLLIRGSLNIKGTASGNDNASIDALGNGVLQTLTCGTFNSAGADATFGGDIIADDFVIPSDERLKSDIKKIPKALDKVKELSGYTYTINEKPSVGVIAQEVLKILPETITTKDDGYYAVSYHGLIGLLIEAVKELSEKVK